MTTFEDLPVPILVKIMDLLSEHTDECNAAEAISKIEVLMGDEITWWEFEVTQDVSVRRCVGRRDKYLWIDETADEKGYSEPYLLYVSSVGMFIVDRRIAIHDYSLLAERFQNLRWFFVGWLNLEMLGEVGTWLTFPKLTHLRLGGPENKRMAQISEYSKNEVLKNLSGFIALLGRVTYPNLTHFSMNIIFEETRENCMLDSLLTFLTRHQKSLEVLKIVMARTQYKDHQDGFIDWLSVPNWEERLRNLALNLQDFVVYFYPYYESKNFLQLVDHISSKQTSLEWHLMMYPRYQTFYTDILDNNFRTLKLVFLSIWIFYTLDSKVFEQCSVLKVLHLHARPKKLAHFETENYGGDPASSELLNIEYLPKSLTLIEIVNFFIETKDCGKFTTEFPKLESLFLFGIGEKEALGLTMELFSAFIHRGGAQIGVYRGFNQKSKLESQGSDDGASIFMNLYGPLPETEKSNLFWRQDDVLRKANLKPFVFARDTFFPIPFDDGNSKYKVYVGQKKW